MVKYRRNFLPFRFTLEKMEEKKITKIENNCLNLNIWANHKQELLQRFCECFFFFVKFFDLRTFDSRPSFSDQGTKTNK
jgi:hypothetical protein